MENPETQVTLDRRNRTWQVKINTTQKTTKNENEKKHKTVVEPRYYQRIRPPLFRRFHLGTYCVSYFTGQIERRNTGLIFGRPTSDDIDSHKVNFLQAKMKNVSTSYSKVYCLYIWFRFINTYGEPKFKSSSKGATLNQSAGTTSRFII